MTDSADNSTYWLPSYFGYRDANSLLVANSSPSNAISKVIDTNTVYAGSWGWPRPDYRMNIDADKATAANGIVAPENNCACWFYCESPNYSGTHTMSIDNPNLLLCSIKFMRFVDTATKIETTQLSFLKHHMLGFDHPWMTNISNTSSLREDMCPTGNMLRSVKIVPYTMSSTGTFELCTDEDLGVDLEGHMLAKGSSKIPRRFDITYKLRHAQTRKDYVFSIRIFTRLKPQ